MKERSKGSEYKCSQVFGYKGVNERIHEEDIISTLKFSHDGKYLALGDKAGRVIMFKTESEKKKDDKFTYHTEFQAYNREFDPLNSTDIEEDVTGMVWLRPQANYQKMLTMNNKIIKLWKIGEKVEKKIVRSAHSDLTLPKFQAVDNNVNAVLQKSFPNKHESDLIGMSPTKNEEYIICSDIAKSHLYNMEKSSAPYLIADFQKDKTIEEMKEGISCLKSHPTSDSLFSYGTNRGAIILSDMRVSGTSAFYLESYNPLTLRINQQKEKSNFFTQMISSYSSISFLNNHRHIAARDYLSIKVWDISKTDKPLVSIPIQESLKTKLCEIFENDSIFDNFSLSMSKDSNTILTGNYNNTFHAIDINDSSNSQYEVNYKKQTIVKSINSKSPLQPKMDYSRKILATDFHPTNNSLAIASLNCFLIYSM